MKIGSILTAPFRWIATTISNLYNRGRVAVEGLIPRKAPDPPPDVKGNLFKPHQAQTASPDGLRGNQSQALKDKLKDTFSNQNELHAAIDQCHDKNTLEKAELLAGLYSQQEGCSDKASSYDTKQAVQELLIHNRSEQADCLIEANQLSSSRASLPSTLASGDNLTQLKTELTSRHQNFANLTQHIEKCTNQGHLQKAVLLSQLTKDYGMQQGDEVYGAMVSLLNGDSSRADQIIANLSSPSGASSTTGTFASKPPTKNIPKWEAWETAAKKFIETDFTEITKDTPKVLRPSILYAQNEMKKLLINGKQSEVRERLIAASASLVEADKESLELPKKTLTKQTLKEIESTRAQITFSKGREEGIKYYTEAMYSLSVDERKEAAL